jgi:molecular chaperone GrpE
VTSAHGERAGAIPGVDEPVIVRDKRRIDPESGEVRPGFGAGLPAPQNSGAATAAPSGVGGGDTELLNALRTQASERTADLQRLKAEFDNYRRRVERDRMISAEQATGKLMTALLPTLDDISRARDHGDLEGPFKAVAETLEATLEGAGLERFGARGDEFDPLVHDALMHAYTSDVNTTTCVDVFRSGYRHAGRVLRPAQVSVAEPSGEAAPVTPDPEPELEPAPAPAPAPAPEPEPTVLRGFEGLDGISVDNIGTVHGSRGGPSVDDGR